MVYKVNPLTGHYYDIANPTEFSKNSINAFKNYAENAGLRLHPDFSVVDTPL